MSKITIIEPNSNDKDQTRNFMVKGERGYSAYDLYVQNGGTLTEEEWLDAFLNATNYYTKTEVDTSLGTKVNTSDIKDNLTSTDTNKPLSANQGQVLKGLIDTNTTAIGTKANASDVTEMTTYSTTEKAVGTWINGETIYRKIVDTGDLTTGFDETDNNKYISHGISNVEKIVNAYCRAYYPSGASFNYDNYIYYSNDWIKLNVNVDKLAIELYYINSERLSGISSSFIVIEYTKTSS